MNRYNPSFNQVKTTFTPASNISKDDNGYTLEISVPGFSKEELELHLDDNNLKVVGKFESDKESKEQFIHRSFSKQPFSISFKLSDTIDAESISAKVENGLLKIHLGLKAEAKKEVINIAIK